MKENELPHPRSSERRQGTPRSHREQCKLTAHGGQVLPNDAQAVKRQRSDTYPFTSMQQLGEATSSAALPVPPAPPAHDPIAEPMAPPAQRGHNPASPEIPRTFCDDILTVLAHLPEEWPLVKIDLILNKAEAYHASWRRFLHLNKHLRTFYESNAATTTEKNADRMIEHLVQVLSEWIIMCIEPARELTRVKEPEFLFLHDKDFWFRSIWIDLHQAISIDRKSSRDRAPVGLVRCICKDDQVKGPNAPIKLKLSNIHVFVPVWMAPTMLRNLRIIAAQPVHPAKVGHLDYREGWFAIVPSKGEPEESLCGIQVHLSDNNLARFPKRGWPAIEYRAEHGLLKPDVWGARRTNLSLKIKIEIPVSGTSIKIQQNDLKFDTLPDSWPHN